MAAVKILEGFLRAEKERTAAAQLSKETETI
jgi:hypothetical protein